MRGLYMGAGICALTGVSNALMRRWTYPDCEADNCYRAFINEQYTELAPSFCLKFLASTTTNAAVIPTPFENCAGDIHAVSSACSCITYTYTHTKTTSTPSVTSTSSTPIITPTQSSSSCSSSTPLTTPSQSVSSTEVPSTTKVPPKTESSSNTQLPTTGSLSTSCSGSSGTLTTPTSSSNSSATSICPTETQPTESSSSSGNWTLSTVYSKTTYMVTSCPSAVTDCPATSSPYLTTTAIPVIVTVYPSSYPVGTPGGVLSNSNTHATSQGATKPTATVPVSGGYSTIPTAAAARARFNEVVIAAGGAIAVAFL